GLEPRGGPAEEIAVRAERRAVDVTLRADCPPVRHPERDPRPEQDLVVREREVRWDVAHRLDENQVGRLPLDGRGNLGDPPKIDRHRPARPVGGWHVDGPHRERDRAFTRTTALGDGLSGEPDGEARLVAPGFRRHRDAAIRLGLRALVDQPRVGEEHLGPRRDVAAVGLPHHFRGFVERQRAPSPHPPPALPRGLAPPPPPPTPSTPGPLPPPSRTAPPRASRAAMLP